MRFSTKTTVLFFSSLLLISCAGNKGAKEYLSDAGKAYQEGNYSLAKLKIDSIKILFPKSFDEINAGFALMQEIRMAENRRNIVYCDSMLQEKYVELKGMLTRFEYIRDERYQEFGDYYPKSYSYHSSLNQNSLRSGVREKGILFIESILSGSAIKHNKIRVSTQDGNFAETLAVTSDGLNYRFNTLDKSYEIVRYSGNSENGVASFIYTFRDQPISLQFVGNRTITVTMPTAAKKGVSDSFELSALLLDIEQLKMEKEKSEALIRYLESKKQ
ncbi:hypothetical protein [Proteiniphilum sp. UBA5384]|uniref:hypothetical protein n=1 Tax=Proteiniphilum sp. UBA5384 TaxID=1947279 RepID=UPI0025FC298A|nr:hypothetical protein [Proteiniphilum sp. UBA5384]